MNFSNISAELAKRKVKSSEFEEVYDGLISKKENIIKAHTMGDWGEVRRIRAYTFVLRQTLLHRAINLFEGSC